MNIPATKEEILENFKKNSSGRPLNKDDYEIAEALSRITYKAYEVGMEDAKQLNMEDMMDNKRCNALHVFKNKTFGQLRTIEEDGKILLDMAPYFLYTLTLYVIENGKATHAGIGYSEDDHSISLWDVDSTVDFDLADAQEFWEFLETYE